MGTPEMSSRRLMMSRKIMWALGPRGASVLIPNDYTIPEKDGIFPPFKIFRVCSNSPLSLTKTGCKLGWRVKIYMPA